MDDFELSEADEQGIDKILHDFDDVFYDEIMESIIESMSRPPVEMTHVEVLMNQYRIFFLRGAEMALKLACLADRKNGVSA